MDWARILAYVTGAVDQELLARNEYLAAENRIIKAQLKGRLNLSDAERGVLGACVETVHLPCLDGVEHFLDHVVRDLGAASWMPSEALAKEGDTGDRR